MFPSLHANPRSNPELRTLYEISHLPPAADLREYFLGAMTILSQHFPVCFAALMLPAQQDDFLTVEAIYGIGKETRPFTCPGPKGLIGEVFKSGHPLAIENLTREPLYEELAKSQKWVKEVQPPLLCIPLLVDGESTGVMNISPLYGSGRDFLEDFHFLSVLATFLAPVIKKCRTKERDIPAESGMSTLKLSLLEEIFEARLTEVLSRIDPYVEIKNTTGLLHDIISLVEKALIKSALEKVGYVQTSAARLLGINRNTLRAKIKELKIKEGKTPQKGSKGQGRNLPARKGGACL